MPTCSDLSPRNAAAATQTLPEGLNATSAGYVAVTRPASALRMCPAVYISFLVAPRPLGPSRKRNVHALYKLIAQAPKPGGGGGGGGYVF
jgi:hypothetical protein